MSGPEHIQDQDLEKEVGNIVSEIQTVLPGVLTLVGFQLFCVINERFYKELSKAEQTVHLIVFCLLAFGAALIMMPAAYRRQAQPWVISRRFIELASRVMTIAMAPLLLTFTMDAYLITRLIFHRVSVGLVVAGIVFAVFVALWFGIPRHAKRGTAGREAAKARARAQTEKADD